MPELGGTSKAAEVLGISVATFNRRRLGATYVYDPVSRTLRPLDLGRTDLRSFMHKSHLVAPTLGGQKLPRSPWEFRLDLLRRYREDGWPGVRFGFPCWGEESAVQLDDGDPVTNRESGNSLM